MMRTTPRRLTTLQFSQMGLTELRTFMTVSFALPGGSSRAGPASYAREALRGAAGACADVSRPGAVSTRQPSLVTATVCSK